MDEVLTERMCAEVAGEIVVFAIGMRINRWWKVWRWLPVLMEMPPMLREQAAEPAIGLLSGLSSASATSASSSTGRALSIFTLMPTRPAEHTWLPGGASTRRSAPAVTWAFGTKPTSCLPVTRNPFTSTCRATVWASPALFTLPRERGPAPGSGWLPRDPERPHPH